MKRHDVIVALNTGHNELESARLMKVARLLAVVVHKELGVADADFTTVENVEMPVKVPNTSRSPVCMKGPDNYQ